MNIFQEIDGIPEEQLHPKFKLLNEITLTSEKNILQSWIRGVVDKDGKMVREFQTTFHSCFWEFYLYKLFNSLGFQLDQTKQVPDFIIKTPTEFYVEAVVSNIKREGNPESDRTLDDQLSMVEPPYLQKNYYEELDEAITRDSNALNSKISKYRNSYVNKAWVNKNAPFIIALSSYDQINYGHEYIYPMLALLYGLYYNAENDAFSVQDSINKPGTDSKIPIGIFKDPLNADISAIIFSCTVTLGKLTALAISHGDIVFNNVYEFLRNCENNKYLLRIVSPEYPENIAEGTFIFHNPHATNKIDENLFSNADAPLTQFFLDDNGLQYSGNATPLVARLNVSKIFPEQIIKPYVMEKLRAYNRASLQDFYDIVRNEV